MDHLLAQYVVEARDCLDEAGQALLALEREPGAVTQFDALFRALHTIKGGAGLFDLSPLVRVTHAAESALSPLRDEPANLSLALIQNLFEILDALTHWVDSIDAGRSLEDEEYAQAQVLIQNLAQCSPSAAPPLAAAAEEKEWIAQIPTTAWLHGGATKDAPYIAIRYLPDEGSFFSGDDPFTLMCQLPGLQALHMQMRDPLPPLDALDTYRCYLKFSAISNASRPELQEYCRPLADQILLMPMDSPASSQVVPATNTEPQEERQAAFRQLLEAQLSILELAEGSASTVRRAGVVQVVGNALRYMQDTAGLSRLAQAEQSAGNASLVEVLRALLQQSAQPSPTEAPSGADRRAAARQSKWLKVEQTKVDRLIELIGEIAVAHNGLLQGLEQGDMKLLHAQLQERHARMQRDVQDIQEIALRMRMLPLTQVLQRLPRLTRDLAQRIDKKVRLEIEGEDTEADKNVVEVLAEPLLHLLRNSLSHGIESAPERAAVGKPEEGRIQIRAAQRGETVVLEIHDDGRGIDAQALKRKAIAGKIIKKAVADKMSRDALLQLVFLPGLSTAAEISEVSGRGVGMDVVKSAIERVGGEVALSSELGRGTSVTLTLPLDIALTKIMAVKVAGQSFGVPMAQVRHTVRSPGAAIRQVKKSQAFAFRDQILPLFQLRELLALPKSRRAPEALSILVVDGARGPVGLAVDSFAAPSDVVVKPLNGILRGLAQYLGNALLPDGSILLVLDVREVVHGA